ncbi:hypothetical protein B0J13DRAFT_557250 [Dactylonectria estremocensis]|uniref:C2H2-type domain-containing protein n=1 Tax=Dactylonectria estremocensis TaxID=1079267 RepID=A0A9P9EN94_9HYPO|nr:hypothetical protein B0J13DRAFT_557250 [Dactylonectria estremocensis]
MELLHDPVSDVVVCANAEIRSHVPVPIIGDRFDVRPTRTTPQTRPPVHDNIMRACEGAVQRVINHFLEDGLHLDPPSPAVLGEAIDSYSRGLGGAPMWVNRTGHRPAEKEPLPAGIQERILSSEFDFFSHKADQWGCENPTDLLPLLSDIPGTPDSALLDSTALSRTWLAVRTAWLSDRSNSGDVNAASPLLAKQVHQDASEKESAGCSRVPKRTASQTPDLPPQAGPKRRRVVASGRYDAGYDDEDDNNDRGSDGDDAVFNRSHGDEANGESRPFACPFYKLNRTTHMDCIGRRLRRICDVKQHLTRRHSQQPFCPTCYETFSSPSIRDDHIRLRRCQAPSTTRASNSLGVSPEAIIRLKDRTSRNVSLIDRWYGIWDIIFPDVPKPPSPYLGSVLEETLGMISAFWRQEASRVVAAFLRCRPTLARDSCDFGLFLMYFLNDVQSRHGRSSRGLDFARNEPLRAPPPPAAALLRRSQDSGNAWQSIDLPFQMLASNNELPQPAGINVVPAMDGFDWDSAPELTVTPLGDDSTVLDHTLDFENFENFEDEGS